MSIPRRDPEQTEQRYMREYASARGKRVIEIGCGAGRLTWLYAPQANHLIGVDIQLSQLRAAQIARPETLATKVNFTAGQARMLPFANESFDLALFSWSLC